MAGVFLSYRRDDTLPYAGRLGDDLKERFGDERVFMDIDTIEPGLDFVDAIESALQSCDALVVVIGKQWLTAVDAKGRRRLDDPNDYVRLELKTALARNIRVIPILVQNVAMPTSDDLPADLAFLARRQALDVADGRWKQDVQRLIDVLDRTVRSGPAPATPTVPDKGGKLARLGRLLRSALPIAFLLLIGGTILLGVTLMNSYASADQGAGLFFFLVGLTGLAIQGTWWWRRRRARLATSQPGHRLPAPKVTTRRQDKP